MFIFYFDNQKNKKKVSQLTIQPPPKDKTISLGRLPTEYAANWESIWSGAIALPSFALIGSQSQAVAVVRWGKSLTIRPGTWRPKQTPNHWGIKIKKKMKVWKSKKKKWEKLPARVAGDSIDFSAKS